MGWPVALALLVVGLLIGQVWARRSRRLWDFGTARPGMAIGATAALVAALVTGVRGLWVEALALIVLAAVLAGITRTRGLPGAAPDAFHPPRGAMTVNEAASLLGVAPDCSRDQVQAAYRRLMRSVHPDQGGTAGLAAQLNTARQVMLERSPL